MPGWNTLSNWCLMHARVACARRGLLDQSAAADLHRWDLHFAITLGDQSATNEAQKRSF